MRSFERVSERTRAHTSSFVFHSTRPELNFSLCHGKLVKSSFRFIGFQIARCSTTHRQPFFIQHLFIYHNRRANTERHTAKDAENQRLVKQEEERKRKKATKRSESKRKSLREKVDANKCMCGAYLNEN